MSTGVAPAVAAPKQARIGSFSITERLNPPEAPAGQITLKVSGLPESPFAGREGIATCYNAPQSDNAREKVEQLLATLENLAHPAIWPVMDVGTSGSVVYWIRSAPTGDTLESESPAPSIRETGQIIQTICGGLQTAHDAGLSHGAIRPASIRKFPSGAWTLYGLGIMGRGPAADQFDLARVVVTQLSGRPWQEPDVSGYPEPEQAYHRGQRLREQLGNTTERVVNVINRAMHLDPAQRYASIAEFGADLANQIKISGDDLVHGAFEAISARNVELARIMAAKAAVYNPESDNLALLNIQLNGGSAYGQAQPAMPPQMAGIEAFVPPPPPVATQSAVPISAPGGPETQPEAATPVGESDLQVPGLTLPPMASPASQPQSVMPPELTQGLPPEMVEMFSAQFRQAPPKKGMNPVFVLVLGGLGMILLLLGAALVTFVVSGG